MDEILSTEETAAVLDVSSRTVINLIAVGNLNAKRVGRRTWAILRSDVERYIASQSEEQIDDSQLG